jgi:hypothetical protein
VPKISFEQQQARDAVEIVKTERSLGNALRGEDLLRAVEQSIGHPLSPELRDLFPHFSAPSSLKRRGRPRSDRGRQDFAMEEVDERYSELLLEFKKEDSHRSRADGAPSERAYRQLAGEMHKHLGSVDWRALRNSHSKWRNGHFHPKESHVDSQDFDAEIERRFPAPERS